MGYNSTTQNLGLPQWILSNPPQMSDFNTAFSKIDEFAGPNGTEGGVARLAGNNAVPITQGGTGATTISDARQNLGLEYGQSDTCDFGNYFIVGLVTTNARRFICTIMLPNPLDSAISQINVSGTAKIRQNGNYLLGTASTDVDFSDLSVTCELCNNRQAFTLEISNSFTSATNNETASLQINNFVISWA